MFHTSCIQNSVTYSDVFVSQSIFPMYPPQYFVLSIAHHSVPARARRPCAELPVTVRSIPEHRLCESVGACQRRNLDKWTEQLYWIVLALTMTIYNNLMFDLPTRPSAHTGQIWTTADYLLKVCLFSDAMSSVKTLYIWVCRPWYILSIQTAFMCVNHRSNVGCTSTCTTLSCSSTRCTIGTGALGTCPTAGTCTCAGRQHSAASVAILLPWTDWARFGTRWCECAVKVIKAQRTAKVCKSQWKPPFRWSQVGPSAEAW